MKKCTNYILFLLFLEHTPYLHHVSRPSASVKKISINQIPSLSSHQHRLLNPKVVRACTLALADWEQIPTGSLKAAVTLLHRIAVGCKMPAMLFQVSAIIKKGGEIFPSRPSLSSHEPCRRVVTDCLILIGSFYFPNRHRLLSSTLLPAHQK